MTRTYGKGVRLAALGLATAVALSLAAPAFAGEKPAAAQGHDTGNGVTAAIDPATGKLRQPTAEESKALALGIQSMLKRSVQSLQLQQAPDGTMSIDLGTAFLNVSIAQVGPDGLLHEICVNDPESAKTLVTTIPAQVYVEK
ncbi:MAG TPA: hypothetical protein VIJ26_10675 [Thermoanaerobaculia bacterium]